MVVPQNPGFQDENGIIWDDVGWSYFRNPPYRYVYNPSNLTMADMDIWIKIQGHGNGKTCEVSRTHGLVQMQIVVTSQQPHSPGNHPQMV